MSKWLFKRKDLRKQQEKSSVFWNDYAKKYDSEWAGGYADCSYDNVRDLKMAEEDGWKRLEFADVLESTISIFNGDDSWHAGYRTALRDLKADLLERKIKSD